jgi:hypothetical protein
MERLGHKISETSSLNVICRAGKIRPSESAARPGGKGLERYGTVKSGRVLSLAAQTGWPVRVTGPFRPERTPPASPSHLVLP